jgi:phage gp45-like
MKNMIDMQKLKELAKFLKAGDTLIITTSGKEYKITAEEAVGVSETLINTQWITTADFQINFDNIASTERLNGSGKGTGKVNNNAKSLSAKE